MRGVPHAAKRGWRAQSPLRRLARFSDGDDATGERAGRRFRLGFGAAMRHRRDLHLAADDARGVRRKLDAGIIERNTRTKAEGVFVNRRSDFEDVALRTDDPARKHERAAERIVVGERVDLVVGRDAKDGHLLVAHERAHASVDG